MMQTGENGAEIRYRRRDRRAGGDAAKRPTATDRFFRPWPAPVGADPELPQCYSIDGLRRLLTNKGPFWVTAAAPGFHAIVVTGMYSDGSDDNTVVRINDPWGPALRELISTLMITAGQYVLSLQQFAKEYETPATYPGVTIRILRSDGRTS
jgi:hypothetical protein